jgi:hypothetical protein
MSLKRAVIHALFGSQNAKSLIKEFDYPLLGSWHDVGTMPGSITRAG